MNLKVLAVFAAFLSLHANATAEKKASLQEVFNYVSNDCVVKIGGQVVNFGAVEQNNGLIVLHTDAFDRADGVYATIELEFDSINREGSLVRASALKSMSFIAKNARSWGTTSMKREKIQRLQVLLAETRQKNIELKASAWIGEDEIAKKVITQTAVLSCKPSNFVSLIDLDKGA